MIIEQIQNIANCTGKTINEHTPLAVTSIVSSGNLVIIKNRFNCAAFAGGALDLRGGITKFSESSSRRMRRYLRETLCDYRVMLTLTYPAGHGFDGARAKRDLRVFLQRLRRYHGFDIKFSAFWFFEFQGRGAVHFHLFLTHRTPKEWIASAWYEVVGSEDKRHLQAGTRIESIFSGKHGMCAYAAKYAAKQMQKEVPESFGWVGRFWGVCGRRSTLSAGIGVTPGEAKQGAVKRRIEALDLLLENAIFSGRARIITPPDAPGIVVYLKDEWAARQAALLIDTMCIAADLYRIPRSAYFEELVDMTLDDLPI